MLLNETPYVLGVSVHYYTRIGLVFTVSLPQYSKMQSNLEFIQRVSQVLILTALKECDFEGVKDM
jgi:hypothetical protein